MYVNSNNIKTDIVLEGSIIDFADATCIVIRDEALIEAPDDMVSFDLKDGEKLPSGCEIATVYKTGDAYKKKTEMKKIDEEIENLEDSKDKYKKISENFNNINNISIEHILKIKQNLLDNNYLNISKQHNEFKRSIVFLNSIFNSSTDIFGTINSLKQKKASIERTLDSKNQEKVISSYSGYFSTFVDGFENSFNIAKIYNVKPKDIDDLLSSNPPKINNKVKIVKTPFWYLILKIQNNKIKNIQINDYVTITSLSENLCNIPAKVIAINTDEKDEFSSFVLKCSYITKEILKLRKEKVRIKLKSYEGLKFNKKALIEKISPKTVKDNETNIETIVNKPIFGVNVLEHGSSKKTIFKEIVPIHFNDNYVICKNKENSNNELKKYDEIILK